MYLEPVECLDQGIMYLLVDNSDIVLKNCEILFKRVIEYLFATSS